jgi:hypothetical protein
MTSESSVPAALATAAGPAQPAGRAWAAAGFALFGYAVLGNYVALPGYRRFLERGGRSEAGNAFDLSVLIGATKTILWMFAFQLGAFCLAYAALCVPGEASRRFRRHFVVGAAVWLGFWSLPRLPVHPPIFFASIGCVILGLICAVLWRARLPVEQPLAASAHGFRICSYLFFALATWEVCGLGSVGRILHADELQRLGTSSLVATQMTKLIAELALAWLFALLGTRGITRRSPWISAPQV